MLHIMHPALRKGPLFYTKETHFPLFYKTPPISFPAYGPDPDYRAIQGDSFDKMTNISIHSYDV